MVKLTERENVDVVDADVIVSCMLQAVVQTAAGLLIVKKESWHVTVEKERELSPPMNNTMLAGA
jgi:hypothetical protein